MIQLCLYGTGKIDIDLNVDIPKNAELLEPLQEGCVWCQVRGAAVEVPGTDKIEASTEKVSYLWSFYLFAIFKAFHIYLPLHYLIFVSKT